MQENRTFDQVFGSLGKGDGDKSLNLFGQESAPNQRQLQRKFVTLDNFYANAEISAQGWNWSVAANSNPYAEALWPANYSGRKGTYPSETHDPAIAPNRDVDDAYIWHRLDKQGVSFRNYGFYVEAGDRAGDPVLDAHTDHAFHGYDLACPDNPDTFTPRSATLRHAAVHRVEARVRPVRRQRRPAHGRSSSGCPTTTRRAPSRACPPPARTSPTTTSRSAGSWTRSRTRGTGRTPRSS